MAVEALGIALVIALALLFVGACWIVWRTPFRALGVLVAGMAVHNIVIMTLIRLNTPTPLIRVIQAWKEGIILFLLILVGHMVWQTWQARRVPRLTLFDFVALGFALIVVIYTLLPQRIMPNEGTLTQRLVSLRVTLLLPLFYGFGRLFWSNRRKDVTWVIGLILGSAAIVGLFGLWELWFVPTTDWVSWGAVRFSHWLGFTYHGPQGLPENYFQGTANGDVLRRMVSTYISPLGVAYTGLLLVPLGVALVTYNRREPSLPRWYCWMALVLVILSVLFSITRGALINMVLEFAALSLLLWRWRLIVLTAAVTVAVAFILIEYINFGPLLTPQLETIRQPAGYALVQNIERSVFGRTSGTGPAAANSATDHTQSGQLVQRTLTAQDPSTQGHLSALRYGVRYAYEHPLGTGVGSAVFRFGTTSGPGESAILRIFGELGLLGGLLHIAMYGLTLLFGLLCFWQYRSDPLMSSFALVACVGGAALLPITLTSDVWGDFSVTFLLWWAAGFSVTMLQLATVEDSATLLHRWPRRNQHLDIERSNVPGI